MSGYYGIAKLPWPFVTKVRHRHKEVVDARSSIWEAGMPGRG